MNEPEVAVTIVKAPDTTTPDGEHMLGALCVNVVRGRFPDTEWVPLLQMLLHEYPRRNVWLYVVEAKEQVPAGDIA